MTAEKHALLTELSSGLHGSPDDLFTPAERTLLQEMARDELVTVRWVLTDDGRKEAERQ